MQCLVAGNGECVPLAWFSLKGCNREDEVFVVTFYGMFRGLLKSSGGSNKTSLALRTFKHVVSYTNNIRHQRARCNCEAVGRNAED